MAQLAEVRMVLTSTSARLIVKSGDKTIEDEVWVPEFKVSGTEADVAARTVFDAIYDFLNFQVNGE